MRLCADENIPAICVLHLQRHGHDVLWIRSVFPGSTDSEVLHRASVDGRLLITFDKDFGDLVFRKGEAAAHGVVLFRGLELGPSALAEYIVQVLSARDDWDRHFSVVDGSIVRMRSLPGFPS